MEKTGRSCTPGKQRLPRIKDIHICTPNSWSIRSCWLMVCLLMMACGGSADPETAPDGTGPIEEQRAPETLLRSVEEDIAEMKRVLDLIDEREHFMKDQMKNDEPSEIMRKRVLYNMRLVNALVAENRSRITELSAALTRANSTDEHQRRMLKDCEEVLVAQELSLAELKLEMAANGFDADLLQQQLSALEAEVAKQEALVESKEVVSNRVWYAVGAPQELRERGVVFQAGVWARLSKRRSLNGSAEMGSFQEADQRTLRRVSINAKRANFLTDHPEGSYRFVADGDRIAGLEITDPNAFWRFSRYLVMEVR